MEEESSVSFTTADGKEVAFKAKKGRAKASAKKKVIETPVTPQEPVAESPVEPPPETAAPVAVEPVQETVREIVVEESVLPKTERVKPARKAKPKACLLYTSPSPRDATLSRMPSSA